MLTLQNEAPEIHTTGKDCVFECRRTCKCCGSSIMFIERKEVDEFKGGLDVCPSCILHFRSRNCLES